MQEPIVGVIFMVPPGICGAAPADGNLLERSRVEVMELVPALAPRLDELGVYQHVDVLRDRLP